MRLPPGLNESSLNELVVVVADIGSAAHALIQRLELAQILLILFLNVSLLPGLASDQLLN